MSLRRRYRRKRYELELWWIGLTTEQRWVIMAVVVLMAVGIFL